MTTELAEWLRACLDEDEAIIRNNLGERGLGDWGSYPDYRTYFEDDQRVADEYLHQFNPPRVLAEVEAKRQILNNLDQLFPHRHVDDCWYSCPKSAEGCCNEDEGDKCNCGAEVRRLRLLRIVAAPYADRPGCQESWAA